MIDAIDKAILNILQQDGRTSNADIARQNIDRLSIPGCERAARATRGAATATSAG